MHAALRAVTALLLVIGAVPKADAQTYSLANDFSLALNGSGGNTWSYGMDTGYSNPVAFFKLPSNTQSADALWGTSFGPNAPTMWTDTSGIAGIGKNTTANTLTDPGTGISWAPGTVLLRPQAGFDSNNKTRLLIGWTAPQRRGHQR